MSTDAERQRELPLRKAAQIAWRGIRVRMARSILVTLGIALPIAFLAYILASDQLAGRAVAHGSRQLLQHLQSLGRSLDGPGGSARIETLWMVGLALMISFVGILNAMLMSVTERFREIGTMKCLGALDAFIIRLFLIESLYQGVVGACAGAMIGAVLALAEGWRLYGNELAGLVDGGLGTRFGISVVAGLVLTVAGAVYPAFRAARMRPVDAMRTEI